ncbi:DUF5605 domain-containing protein [Nocardioides sp. GY 10127]|uniref:DUF5605 domain-containing protein n=1 Tax=Nocardioides sp. GY 10127 TaxID=2569762 RepID=UPI0010A8772B|nr:DUF5605 domain-containing protein [Nocardioides sp. GY 10127]TIC85474.1 DUF5060 domain-containing protein [Nocardioides sp. GY 10127]
MFDRASTFGEALDSPAARAVLETYLPGVAASPMAAQFREARLGQVAAITPALRDDPEATERLWAALALLEDGVDARAPYAPAVLPDPGYEDAGVPRASAEVVLPGPVPRWGAAEVVLLGPGHGNPFVDVEVTALFVGPDGRERRVGGFHDGPAPDGRGRYVLRLLAEVEGRWRFSTTSTARSLDGLAGHVDVGPAATGTHGPVRVDGMHFAHADGTRYRPVGTTAYAWTHQPEQLVERTLATLAEHAFTKVRMCLFPKSYLYNTEEPAAFAFPRREGAAPDATGAQGFDVTRFDVAWWRDLERRIGQLAALGVQADLILLHPYDRWGFTDLGPAVDERYLRYAVRRLAGLANVWWSMANEYDLLWSKTVEDWERLAAVVVEEDPHDHLLSIHNCHAFYDYSRPWVTHVSNQRVDVYRTAEEMDGWRERWGKPVVCDECAYEGDLDQGWGNVTGQELVRRCWEGAVRGGYVAHGETYLNEAEELWWSKGGELVGSSPARMAFLDSLLAQAPDGVWDPLPSDWDVPWGGVAGRVLVGYLGFSQPRFRTVVLPEGSWRVEVIDTWEMTVTPLPGLHEGAVRVDLPGRQYLAIRATRV